MMRIIALALMLAAAPAAGQETSPRDAPGGGPAEGLSLIERGVRLLFRNLLDEMEPTVRDFAEGLEGFVTEAEPMLRQLARIMGDVRSYHAPEILPNGDIIIRRKSPEEIAQDDEIEI
jgi:hypothetical protein